MPDRILLTLPFECRIVDGVAYLDTGSDGKAYALAMPLPLFIASQQAINDAINATKR